MTNLARQTHSSLCRPRPVKTRRAFTLVELVIVIGLILLLVAITVTVSVGVMRQSEVRESQNVVTILDNALQEWLLQEGREISYGRGATMTDVTNGEPCGSNTRPHVYQLPQLSPAGTIWSSETDEGPGLTFLKTAQHETDFLIARLLQRPVFEDMIASIDARYMRRVQVIDPPEDQQEQPADLVHLTEGGNLDFTPSYIYRFVDAWERPILAVHPGRAFDRNCTDDNAYCVGSGTDQRCADEDGTIRTPLENVFGVAENRRIYFVSGGPSERFGMLALHRAATSLTQDDQRRIDRAEDNIYSYPVLKSNAARPGTPDGSIP